MADLLANLHDWPTDKVESEFVTCVTESFPALDPEFVRQVLVSFLALPPTVRFDPDFDHERFVAELFL